MFTDSMRMRFRLTDRMESSRLFRGYSSMRLTLKRRGGRGFWIGSSGLFCSRREYLLPCPTRVLSLHTHVSLNMPIYPPHILYPTPSLLHLLYHFHPLCSTGSFLGVFCWLLLMLIIIDCIFLVFIQPFHTILHTRYIHTYRFKFNYLDLLTSHHLSLFASSCFVLHFTGFYPHLCLPLTHDHDLRHGPRHEHPTIL